MKIFQYKGDGAGIPGLPHVISQEEIDQFSVEQAQLWKAAFDSGAYVGVEQTTGGPLPADQLIITGGAQGKETIVPPKAKSKKSDTPKGASTDEGA